MRLLLLAAVALMSFGCFSAGPKDETRDLAFTREMQSHGGSSDMAGDDAGYRTTYGGEGALDPVLAKARAELSEAQGWKYSVDEYGRHVFEKPRDGMTFSVTLHGYTHRGRIKHTVIVKQLVPEDRMG